MQNAASFDDRDFEYIRRKIESDKNMYSSIWQTWWSQASIDTRLEAGVLSLSEYSPFGTNLNNTFFFNRTRPLLNLVSGYQRRNRKSCVVVPLENGDQQTADQYSKLLLGIFKRANLYETISEAFHQGACITGLSLIHSYLDFTDDPISGDIKAEMLPFNQFCIDPYFRDPALSDCSFIWRRTYMPASQAALLIPDRYDDIMAVQPSSMSRGPDNNFMYMPEAVGINKSSRVSYDEYYYRATRKRTLLQDKRTLDVLDVTIKDNFDVDRFLATYPQVKLIEQEIPTVRLAIMVNNKVFYDGPNPLLIDDYPFTLFTGYNATSLPNFYDRFSGIARSLRDPQLLYNRRVILTADLQESLLNSGWIVDPDSVIDIKQLYQTGNGRVIALKKGANPASVQQIQAPNVPPSVFQLEETYSKEMNMDTGISEELTGMATEDLAGILSRLRQGAGLTSLQPIFDKLDQSQIRLGDLHMKIVRANYTPTKIKNIIGVEPAPFFYNKAFGTYKCTVQLGFDTETQQQMQFLQLLQLKQLGIPIPDSALIESATIQNKTELLQQMQQQAQAAEQQQQQQMQFELKEQQARTALAQSQAVANKGLGIERLSRVKENEALAIERKAEAVKDDNQAVLNLVKALKEIEGMDLEHLERIMTLQGLINNEKQTLEQSVQEGPGPVR